ncbi:enoyl-CoA hydratase/isomerase family protein [Streptomyces sp. YKOK-I1]
MLSCDVVVPGAPTKFVSAYADVRLTPDCAVSYLLTPAIRQQRALELALTRRGLAEEARQWGLVPEVVDGTSVDASAVALADRLAAAPAPALGRTRRLMCSSSSPGCGRAARRPA